jgi:hypothetical protein
MSCGDAPGYDAETTTTGNVVPGGLELRPSCKNETKPNSAKAMNTMAVIMGRVMANRVNHTIEGS